MEESKTIKEKVLGDKKEKEDSKAEQKKQKNVKNPLKVRYKPVKKLGRLLRKATAEKNEGEKSNLEKQIKDWWTDDTKKYLAELKSGRI